MKYFLRSILTCISVFLPLIASNAGELPPAYYEKVDYDPMTGLYTVRRVNASGRDVEAPLVLTRKQWTDYVLFSGGRKAFSVFASPVSGTRADSAGMAASPGIRIDVDSPAFDGVFGGSKIEITPYGTIRAGAGVSYTRTDNPLYSERQRSHTGLEFSQAIGAGVSGRIGDKLTFSGKVSTSGLSPSGGEMNIRYTGYPEDIIQSIEAGAVSLSVPNGLFAGLGEAFGVKSRLRLGNVYLDAFFGQRKAAVRTVTVTGSSGRQETVLKASDYDGSRHYFISRYFGDTYDGALKNYPFIDSRVKITRMEVWVTSGIGRGAGGTARAVVALADLGETAPFNPSSGIGASQGYPYNEANGLAALLDDSRIRDLSTVRQALPQGFVQDEDFLAADNMRLLSPSEYTFDAVLGCVHLASPLTDGQALAVAFQYIAGGRTYTVGEFSTGQIKPSDAVVLKLLSPLQSSPSKPVWELMMKNVYSLGVGGISHGSVAVNVTRTNASKGAALDYVPEAPSQFTGRKIAWVLGADRLDAAGNATPEGRGDGIFDVVEGITVHSDKGFLVFPCREPFGRRIEELMSVEPALAAEYSFAQLYSSAQSEARKQISRDIYSVRVVYSAGRSAMGGVFLGGVSLAQGSVQATAQGRTLVEGADYAVDYELGRITIVNPAYAAVPVTVEISDASAIESRSSRIAGLGLEYRPVKNLMLHASLVNVSNRPSGQKVGIGQNSTSNTMTGFGVAYSMRADFLTRAADFVTPFQSMSAPSEMTFTADVAHLSSKMQRSRAISGENSVYIDDFEDSSGDMDLKSPHQWVLASTPMKVPDIVPSGQTGNVSPLEFNYARAAVAWYTIDPVFYYSDSRTPSDIRSDKKLVSRDDSRRVYYEEIYPEADIVQGMQKDIGTFDIFYDPGTRGPYNHNYASMDDQGRLSTPAPSHWGGIMRRLPSSDLEGRAVSYLHIWLMYPYGDGAVPVRGQDRARMMVDLGGISEDVFSLGLRFDESSLSVSQMEKTDTPYGYAGGEIPQVASFSQDIGLRMKQDVGLNGMDDVQEREKFPQVTALFQPSSPVYADPAGDNYRYYKSSLWDGSGVAIPRRYAFYNNTQGNTVSSGATGESGYSHSTGMPDALDYNRDGVLSADENYRTYSVSLAPDSLLTVGRNHVTSVRTADVKLPDGTSRKARWVEMKIPLNSPYRVVGTPDALSNVSAARIYITGADTSVVLRFARLSLSSGHWAECTADMLDPDGNGSGPGPVVTVSRVSLEENSSRYPVPYVVPDGVERERIRKGTVRSIANESSLSIRAETLAPGQVAAAYRELPADVRGWGRLRMFVHAEGLSSPSALKQGDLSVFLRMGASYSSDYYQVEKPAVPTEWGAVLPGEVWPSENSLDLPLDYLSEVKTRRDRAVSEGSHQSVSEPFTAEMGGYRVTVAGNPSLGQIRGFVIGMRNVSKRALDVEVWVDELRAEAPVSNSSWAADVSVSGNMSSLAQFKLQGSYMSSGFGTVNSAFVTGNSYSSLSYDFSTRIQLGYLFPEKWMVRFPVYYSRSAGRTTPKYFPGSDDVLLSSVSDSLKRISAATDSYTAFGITALGKARPLGRAARIYDVENFSFSYDMTRRRSGGYTLASYSEQRHLLSLGYSYSKTPYRWVPFSKSGIRVLKDFNFSPVPSALHFKVQARRVAVSSLARSLYGDDYGATGDYSYSPDFTAGYAGGFTFDFTRSLRLSLRGEGSSVVETGIPADASAEPSPLSGLFDAGRATQYHQKFDISYSLPFSSIGWADWIEGKAAYSADFDWRAPTQGKVLKEDGTAVNYGNTVQNAGKFSFSAKFDFEKLYGKVSPSLRVVQDGTTAPLKASRKKYGPWDTARMLRSVGFSYSGSSSVLLPGFCGQAGFMGLSAVSAAGLDFLLGSRTDVINRAFLRGNLTADGIYITQDYLRSRSQSYSYTIDLEPFPGLRINLKGSRESYSSEASSFSTVYYPDQGAYVLDVSSGRTSGSVNMTRWAFGSFFKKNTEEHSAPFEKMKSNIPDVAMRLGEKYGVTDMREDGFPAGLPSTHPEVLTYSFLSAYFGERASNTPLEAFRSIPLPEISVSYDGIGRLPFMRRWFSQFKVSSRYSAWYSINDFTSNPSWGMPWQGEYYFPQQYSYNAVNIVEAFDPLFRIEAKLLRGVSMAIDYRRDRMVSLDVSSARVSENTGRQWGAYFSGTFLKKIDIRSDFSVRNNYLTLRSVADGTNQVGGGERFFSAAVSLDYRMNRRFTAGFSLSALWRRYRLSFAPAMFKTQGGFSVSYDLGG